MGSRRPLRRCWPTPKPKGQSPLRKHHGHVLRKEVINKGKSEGELGIDSAKQTYEQIQKIDPAIRVASAPAWAITFPRTKSSLSTMPKPSKLSPTKRLGLLAALLVDHHDSARPRRNRTANTASSTNTTSGASTTNTTAPAAANPRQPWPSPTSSNLSRHSLVWMFLSAAIPQPKPVAG